MTMDLEEKVRRTLVASPCHGEVSTHYHHGMMCLMRTWHGAFQTAIKISSDIPKNRESLANSFLHQKDGDGKHAFDWILYIDTDMGFPDGQTVSPDVLTRLHSWNVYFVAAIGTRRKHPAVPCCAKGEGLDHVQLTHFPTDLCRVSATGVSCALIHRHVFEKVPEPWFLPMWNPKTKGIIGEDYSFCVRVKEAGIGIHVDATMPLVHFDGGTDYTLPHWYSIWETDESVRKLYPRQEADVAQSLAPPSGDTAPTQVPVCASA